MYTDYQLSSSVPNPDSDMHAQSSGSSAHITRGNWNSGPDRVWALDLGFSFASRLDSKLSNYNFNGLTNRKS